MRQAHREQPLHSDRRRLEGRGAGLERACGQRAVHIMLHAVRENGTLEPRKPLCSSKRRCTYAGCNNPTESRVFYRIDGESKAGGQDWSRLAGSVLCSTCYHRFHSRGTLERSDYRRPLCSSERRCTYAGCNKPTESSAFHRIDGDSKAGGRDWSGLAGSLRCHTCYNRFRGRGTLERNVGRNPQSEPLDSSAHANLMRDHPVAGKRKRKGSASEQDE